MKHCLLYWLFMPFYTTRLYVILDWLERKHDRVIVWPERIHWYSHPSIERASDVIYADEI